MYKTRVLIISERKEQSIKYKKLIDKLLKYSVPYISEDDEEQVEIRFFVDEVIDFIYCFVNMNDIDYETQYYSVLLKVREKIKEKSRVQKK